MPGHDDTPTKPPNSFSNFIGKQWQKMRNSSTQLDRMLEEEYETLLREIDYLTCCEKTCLLSFKNDRFHHHKSSEDLGAVLNRHSEEVLRTYAEKHRAEAKKKSFSSRNSLVNYVTKIVVSQPKCNKNACTCGGEGSVVNIRVHGEPKNNERENKVQAAQGIKSILKIPHDSSGDSSGQSKRPKEVDQSIINQSTNQRIFDDQITNQRETVDHRQANQRGVVDGNSALTVLIKKILRDSEVQTDDWDHDPECLCGYCPKTNTSPMLTHTASVSNPNPDSRNLSTMNQQEPLMREASTSNQNFTASKMILANCSGDTRDAVTSTNSRICLSENFSPTADKFVPCNLDKRDCSCEVFDAKEAVRRGLVLPGSEMCIQSKKVAQSGTQSTSSSDKGKFSSSSSDSWELSDNKKRKQKNGTGCFGSKKKKRGCDEYCQGIVHHEQSIQTLERSSLDTNQEITIQKTSGTSTISAEVQVSSRQINQNHNQDLKLDKQTSHYEDKSVDGKKSLDNNNNYHKDLTGDRDSKSRSEKDHESKTSRSEKDQDSKEKMNVCSRCGRQKRDCVSACRNTFIIPYASNSGTVPAGDSESLRMLIKMQSKDTNRQIDTIMTEINHQKTEMRRLNDMYQKVAQTVYETQKSLSSYNQSNASQRSEGGRSCGCSNSNECSKSRGDNNRRRSKSKSAGEVISDCCPCPNNNNNNNSGPVKRYGPPNTAVAINMCDTCTVEIAANNTRNSAGRNNYEFFENNKEHKEQINQRKKVGQNLMLKLENMNCESGDFEAPIAQHNSVSTIFKPTRRVSEQNHNLVANKEPVLVKKQKQEEPDNNVIKEPIKIKESLDKIELDMNDLETDPEYVDEPTRKKPHKTYSSRVLLWLKKSWVSIRHKHDECKVKHEDTRKEAAKHFYDFCHSAAKHAAVKAWNAAKKKMGQKDSG